MNLDAWLTSKKKYELKGLCRQHGIAGFSQRNLPELRDLILDTCAKRPGLADQLMAANTETASTSADAAPAKPVPSSEIPEAQKAPAEAIPDAEAEPAASKSRSRRLWKAMILLLGIVGSVASIIGLVMFWPKPAPYPWQADKHEPFENLPGFYNILILPFSPKQDCTTVDTHFEEEVKERLLQKSAEDDLDIQVKFFRGMHCPRDFDEARELGQEYNADLVVWGDYYEVCQSEFEACIKYALVEQVHGVDPEGESRGTNVRLSEIREGKLQGDVDFVILWSMGMREYERENYQQAIAYFEGIEEKTATVWLAVGYCYMELANYQSAEEAYSNSIELEPLDPIAYHNRGISFSFLRQLDCAIQDFDCATEIDPDYSRVFSKRGHIYYHLDEYQKALADINRAIEIDPFDSYVFYSRSLVYWRIEKYAEAIQDFERFIELASPEDSWNRANAEEYIKELREKMDATP